MANNHKRDEWLQDVQAPQHNTVFPDTVRNETRLWRNLARAGRLTITQIIGVALIFSLMLAIVLDDAARKFRYGASGSLLDRLLAAAVDWLIWIPICSVAFLVLRWRVRRALSAGTEVPKFVLVTNPDCGPNTGTDGT
jgi:hypothetical protein